MNSKQIALDYWNAWQKPNNWSEVRSMMADDFTFDSGALQTDTADEIVKLMKKGNPWEDVQLRECVAEGGKVAICYEGTDSMTKTRFRISEMITVDPDRGKVISAWVNMSDLG
ncbi:MAG: hypothetical protein KDC12_09890 [Flavobacteriales bacterium]|nr:hypothetical protein [Flavobacteriales bacterium]